MLCVVFSKTNVLTNLFRLKKAYLDQGNDSLGFHSQLAIITTLNNNKENKYLLLKMRNFVEKTPPLKVIF